jgi:hypothetical protein
VPERIVRINDPDFRDSPLVEAGKHIGIDLLSNPSQAVARDVLFSQNFWAEEAADFLTERVQLLILLLKHAYWQLYRLLHPRAVVPQHLGTYTISEDTLLNVQAFFTLFMPSSALTTLYLILWGVDMTTSISVVASALGNGYS